MEADAARLLHELGETWRSLGKDQDKDLGTGVLRACAMTLIVAAAEADDPQELGAMLSSLMQLHPSRRTIVVRTCPHRDEVEARTSVQCWMPFGRRQQICGELIEIYAGAAQFGEVALLPPGLTVPDLPVVFWVRYTALGHLDSLRPVLSLATRVIVIRRKQMTRRARSMLSARWRRGRMRLLIRPGGLPTWLGAASRAGAKRWRAFCATRLRHARARSSGRARRCRCRPATSMRGCEPCTPGSKSILLRRILFVPGKHRAHPRCTTERPGN